METERAGLPILSFADAAAWEAWLTAQPLDSKGVWLKLAKQSAGAECVGKARAFFGTLTGANSYAILYRVHDAKKPETRAARIARFVAMCAAGETVHG